MKKHLKHHYELNYASWQVVKKHPTIIILPIITLAICLLLLYGFFKPHYAQAKIALELGRQTLAADLSLLATVLFFFFFYHLIINFFNCVLITSIAPHFENKPVNILSGFKQASRIFWPITLWTLYSTTIGISLRLVEGWSDHWDSLSFVKNVLANQIWRIASYLVLPIITFEKRFPVAAITRSSQLLTNTWGKSLRVNFRVTAWLFLLKLIALVIIIIGVFVGGATSITLAITVALVLFFSAGMFNMLITMNIRTALYLYVTNQLKIDFAQKSLAKAFKSTTTVKF